MRPTVAKFLIDYICKIFFKPRKMIRTKTFVERARRATLITQWVSNVIIGTDAIFALEL